MILETTQLLNNTYITHDTNYVPVYRATHLKHPASLWTSKSAGNFNWLLHLGLELCQEYSYRYYRRHKCEDIIKTFRYSSSRLHLPVGDMTPFALCMPEKYYTEDAVKSYRLYYKNEKSHLAKWTRRGVPEWWKE